MKKIIAFAAVCMLGLFMLISIPALATQYDPPWADNFGAHFSEFDTTDYADDAETYQDYVGYEASSNHDWNVYDAVSLMDDDAIWTTSGHGRAGAALFEDTNNNQTELVANSDAIGQLNYARLDQVSDLADLRLAVFIGCSTGVTQGSTGNLLNVANSAGVDAALGFTTTIYHPQMDTWGDGFFYHLAIEEDTVTTAAWDAAAYTWTVHYSYGNTNYYSIAGNGSEKIVPDGYGDS